MNLFLGIVIDIILPIFLIIGVGALLDHFRELDLPTLSSLNFVVFVPALLFLKVYEAEFEGGVFFWVAGFSLLHGVIVYLASAAIARFTLPLDARGVANLCTVFSNCGNFGIPFTLLAFGDAYIGPLAAIMMVQNFLVFTAGFWILAGRSEPLSLILRQFFRVPVVYAILLAGLMRRLDVPLPEQLAIPTDYIADALIGMALITLGVQLRRSSVGHRLTGADRRLVPLATAMRLGMAPLLAVPVVWLMGFRGEMAVFLFVLAGMPGAVNAFILCTEYGRHADAVAHIIFWTTLLTALTLPALLLLAPYLMPA